ncbi:ParB/Srx family N-terminal domain-containing protein [Phycicoccus mangrovi]|nr:ParB/Srx family N-terminal domain-containing protein [Phycicoccus mangrovi]
MAPDRDDVERTHDGRYVVVDGRRWRATDPGIPTRCGPSSSPS